MASSPSSLLPLALVVLALVVVAIFSAPAAATSSCGEKRTHMLVYGHERWPPAPNATVAQVLPPLQGANATFFGQVGVLDDELRTGADPASDLVGRLQGVFAGADMEEPSYQTAVSLVFTAGEHRGSTLELQGRLRVPDHVGAVVERAIVGGTGALRMARGYSLVKVLSIPPKPVVFQLDLFVFTPVGEY
ncbi:hypothetical protein U9M48_015881 [Paspalum notatum var. saurae]|uniref:Dirigent protein n=1 Tax=Paspalum notatum var. saurae TaxID=547442 RepID=A0AAQ3T7P4_PASNO